MTISQRSAPPEEVDDDGIIRLTPEEWRAAAQRELDEFGLTYEELEKQAEDESFVSSRAKALWMWISGTF